MTETDEMVRGAIERLPEPLRSNLLMGIDTAKPGAERTVIQVVVPMLDRDVAEFLKMHAERYEARERELRANLESAYARISDLEWQVRDVTKRADDAELKLKNLREEIGAWQ